jgi:hypothetical protein
MRLIGTSSNAERRFGASRRLLDMSLFDYCGADNQIAGLSCDTMHRPEVVPAQTPLGSQPIWRAALFEEFLRLRDCEHFTVTGAAKAVGLHPSAVSGENSLLSRYLRRGLAELERHGSGAASKCVIRQHSIELPIEEIARIPWAAIVEGVTKVFVTCSKIG